MSGEERGDHQERKKNMTSIESCIISALKVIDTSRLGTYHEVFLLSPLSPLRVLQREVGGGERLLLLVSILALDTYNMAGGKKIHINLILQPLLDMNFF